MTGDLAFNDRGLVPAIVQDSVRGTVLMLGWMNAKAIELTRTTGVVHFYSRSRQTMWLKGETSGNQLDVVEVRVDCDRDAVLVRASPRGPTCHTGERSCFYDSVEGGERLPAPSADELDELLSTMKSRVGRPATESYTAKLLDGGAGAIAAKVREEGGELADALISESDERVVSEAADVIYHLMVGLVARGVDLDAVRAELARRAGKSGLAEKAGRTPKDES